MAGRVPKREGLDARWLAEFGELLLDASEE
jgi:hypothetical protein